MKVAQLFSSYASLKWGESAQKDIVNICSDSREVGPGSVFVAIKGHTVDGHDFLPAVCEKALAVVVESEEKIPKSYEGAVLKVADTRYALNLLASRFFGQPAEKMFCVGVTGTNGKTTTTHMIEAVLTKFGWPTGVIGTIDHHLGDRRWETALTTPDAITFQKRLSEFEALEAKSVAIEVSSIALDQNRADAIPFDLAVFTNLSQDHLDYHANMDTYFRMKQKLFTDVLAMSTKQHRFAIINKDDSWARKLQYAENIRVWTYGQKDADLCFRVNRQSFKGSWVELETPHGFGEFHIPLPGLFNVYNAVAAVGVGLAAGASLDVCFSALESLSGVPGRWQRIENKKDLNVFVDYAHTDDALRNILQSANEIRRADDKAGRLITIFGCGGDRDQSKRPLMGQVASEFSDIVFLTSDNPRNEDPQKIIEDVLQGMDTNNMNESLFVEVDRRKAFERAIQSAHPEDVIIVAGKGHEDYQVVGEEKVQFSDADVLKEILNG